MYRRIAIAAMLIVSGLFIVACGGIGGDTKTNQKVVEKPDAPLPERGKSPAVQTDHWADAGNAVRQGDVRVTIETVSITNVSLLNLGQPTESRDKLLQIVVRIENLSETKKITYQTWAARSTDILASGKASVSDEFDNSYSNAQFGFGLSVVDQQTVVSIYPGKSVTDVLAFEEPIKKARLLKIELPASAFGGKGMLRMKVALNRNVPKKTVEPTTKPLAATPTPAPVEKTQPAPPKKTEADIAREQEKSATRALSLAKQFLGKNEAIAKKRLKAIVAKYPKTKAATEAKTLLDGLK